MDKKISLRKAKSRDIVEINAILFSSLKEYEIPVPDNYSVSDIDSIDVKNNIEQVFVLLRDDSVIGFIVLIRFNKDCLELKRLYLRYRLCRFGKF